MTIYAKDLMDTSFHKIHEDAPVEYAINLILSGKIRTGHKADSVMVVDDFGHLTGVISIYDILYNLRPDFLNLNIDAHRLSWAGKMEGFVKNLNKKKAKQVMSTNVMSASMDDHIMVILDQMIKNKFRRLPVVDLNKPIGVIYLRDIYNTIFKQFL